MQILLGLQVSAKNQLIFLYHDQAIKRTANYFNEKSSVARELSLSVAIIYIIIIDIYIYISLYRCRVYDLYSRSGRNCQLVVELGHVTYCVRVCTYIGQLMLRGGHGQSFC